MPSSLVLLFNLFEANYKNLWSDYMKTEEETEAMVFLWTTFVGEYSEHIVRQAGLKAIEVYNFPPSMQQFLEIAKGISRGEKMERETNLRLSGGSFSHHVSPPDPKLAEYMANHPESSLTRKPERLRDLIKGVVKNIP